MNKFTDAQISKAIADAMQDHYWLIDNIPEYAEEVKDEEIDWQAEAINFLYWEKANDEEELWLQAKYN